MRTIQIDAPESTSTRFRHPDECGAEAKRFADALVNAGQRVTLEFAGENRTDAYGRLLAVVHLGQPRAITWQEKMARAGWAEVLVYHGATTSVLPRVRADADYAKAHQLGVWMACRGHFHDPGEHR